MSSVVAVFLRNKVVIMVEHGRGLGRAYVESLHCFITRSLKWVCTFLLICAADASEEKEE